MREIVLLVLLSLPFSFVYAVKSDEYILELSRQMYHDCKDYKITVKGDSILGAFVINGFTLEQSAETYTLEPTWHNLYELIKLLPQHEPYIVYENYPEEPYPQTSMYSKRAATLHTGESFVISNSGLGVLHCGDKVLDVNGDQYFWGGKLFELPKVENNYNLTLLGLSIIANSEITGIGITILSFGFLSISLISVSVLLIVIPNLRVKVYTILRRYFLKR